MLCQGMLQWQRGRYCARHLLRSATLTAGAHRRWQRCVQASVRDVGVPVQWGAKGLCSPTLCTSRTGRFEPQGCSPPGGTEAMGALPRLPRPDPPQRLCSSAGLGICGGGPHAAGVAGSGMCTVVQQVRELHNRARPATVALPATQPRSQSSSLTLAYSARACSNHCMRGQSIKLRNWVGLLCCRSCPYTARRVRPGSAS